MLRYSCNLVVGILLLVLAVARVSPGMLSMTLATVAIVYVAWRTGYVTGLLFGVTAGLWQMTAHAHWIADARDERLLVGLLWILVNAIIAMAAAGIERATRP